MKKNVFYVGVISLLTLLMIIGFLLPFMSYKDAHYHLRENILSYGRLSLFITSIVIIAIAGFFVYKKTKQEEDVKELNWPLIVYTGYMVFVAFEFLRYSISVSGVSEEYTNRISIAPFYMIIVGGLAVAFYLTRVKVYEFANQKLAELIEKRKEKQKK
jgi:di/tricarboxylate transporter